MSLAWGGFANGIIPASSLHVIPNFNPIYPGVTTALASNKMMTEAAVQFSGFAQAFYDRFKKPLNVSEAYRRLDRQQTLYADYLAHRGNLAAYPGTSNHGWGRSLDLASNVNINGSTENTWARQNAPSYGFYFTVPSEAWHVDYIGAPTKRVASYINNPNIASSSGGSAPKNEDDMDRIIRNTKTGSVDWVNVATGFIWHVPSTGYVGIVEQHLGRKTEDLADNFHQFFISRAKEQRSVISKSVWDTVVSGYNGDASASRRLAGIDAKADSISADAVKSIVAAIPKSSGTVNIDAAALAKAIAPLITSAIAKAVNDDAAKRMEN